MIDIDIDQNKLFVTIKKLKKERGICYKHWCDKLGITKNYFSMVINGHKNLSLEKLIRLQNEVDCFMK